METEILTTEEAVAATEPTGSQRHRNRGEYNGSSSSGLNLGPHDRLEGKLTLEGDLRVEGTLEGEISAGGDVQIEKGGTVKARIEARNVTIRGEVEGDVVARKRLLLAGSGLVTGNVQIERLSIEDGATLNGNVSMKKDSSEG